MHWGQIVQALSTGRSEVSACFVGTECRTLKMVRMQFSPLHGWVVPPCKILFSLNI